MDLSHTHTLISTHFSRPIYIISEFAKVCELSTDFHFPNLDQQFMTIEEQLQGVTDTQRKIVTDDGDKLSTKSSGSSSSGETQVSLWYG